MNARTEENPIYSASTSIPIPNRKFSDAFDELAFKYFVIGDVYIEISPEELDTICEALFWHHHSSVQVRKRCRRPYEKNPSRFYELYQRLKERTNDDRTR